eukprot:365661-Chlamydomonas_euryale.AAC.90
MQVHDNCASVCNVWYACNTYGTAGIAGTLIEVWSRDPGLTPPSWKLLANSAGVQSECHASRECRHSHYSSGSASPATSALGVQHSQTNPLPSAAPGQGAEPRTANMRMPDFEDQYAKNAQAYMLLASSLI